MLQDIRENAQGTIAKVVVGLIVFTFALFGVDSIIGGLGGEPEVATVNGIEIKESELLRAVNTQKRQVLAKMGPNADPNLLDEVLLKKSVLDSLIDQKILLSNSEKADLYVSDEAINQLITSFPEFNQNGKFNNDALLAFLSNTGLSLGEFRTSLRKEILTSQYRNAIAGSSFVLPHEIDRLIRLDGETRDFDVTTIAVADFMDADVSEAEVQERYESTKSSFVQPDTADVTYLEMTKDGIMSGISVTDEELKAKYADFVKSYQGKEERKSSHILIEVNDKMTAEQALEKAKSIQAEINSGLAFDEAAKKYSEDAGTAKLGGALGYITRDTFDSDFENALFAMQLNTVSSPVKTSYGYHLIKLDDIRAETAPSFDDIRTSMELEIKGAMAERQFVALQEKLADISYAASDLQEPAHELGLEIKQLNNVAKGAVEGDFSHPALQRSLFSSDVISEGRNTDVIEIAPDKVIVAHVSAFRPEHLKELSEVKAEIYDELKQEKASKNAMNRGETLLAALNAKEDASGVSWVKHEKVARNFNEESPELIAAVFATALNTQSEVYGTTQLSNGDIKVFRLTAIHESSQDSIPVEQKNMLTRMLGANSGNVDYQAYRESIKTNAQVERL
ncbi:MAG: SurA N-terminal domain-containing protein [Hahellaceae bacterium]|nr:SurA N-terminal domain-containing protein [Hahellaceae bacterium]